MLAFKNRLKQNDQVNIVFKKGRTAYSQFLFAKYLPTDLDTSRFAFSIGLKYSKKATERNRAKRILRSAVGKFISQIKPGYDLVFYLKDVKEKEIEYNNIEARVQEILNRAKLIKTN